MTARLQFAFSTFDSGRVGQMDHILAKLCGRGDKDIFSVAEHLGVEL